MLRSILELNGPGDTLQPVCFHCDGAPQPRIGTRQRILSQLYRDYLVAGNYLAPIGFRNRLTRAYLVSATCVDYLVAWTIWFRIYCASNRHSPTLAAVRDGRERRDDGHDNFHASPRRLDEPKSSATCFFFVCIWLHMNTEVITTLAIAISRV